MEKLVIIKQLEENLNPTYKYATITVKDSKMPLTMFLENTFINYVKEDANINVLADYVKNKLGKIIEIENLGYRKAIEFISSYPEFIDNIQISEDEYRSSKDFIIEYAIKNIREDGLLNYPRTDGIEFVDLYNKLLKDQYKPLTIEQRAELCENMIRYINNPEILSSIIDEMNMSVRDYITKVLPTQMKSATTVKIGGQELEINEVVTQLYEYQVEKIEREKEENRKKQEAKNNKANENLDQIFEIELVSGDNNKLYVTSEIPVVKSSNLDEEETISLVANYKDLEMETSEEYYRMQLNNIKSSIDKTTNEHDLAAKEELFNKLCEEAMSNVSSIYIQSLISSITELITIKRNNIIKVSSNQEDYVDILFSKINQMKTDLAGFTTADEFSKLIGEATSLYEDVQKKGIKDIQLRAEIENLISKMRERRLNLDSTIPDQSPEVERIKVDLDDQLSKIKSDILSIEHDPNNLGNLTGTEIRLNHNIEVAEDAIKKADYEHLLTEDDKEYYMNKLAGYRAALQSEAKIGYGLR